MTVSPPTAPKAASSDQASALPTPPSSDSVTLAIDAMSGEQGPAAAVEGAAIALARRDPKRAIDKAHVIFFGDEATLKPLVARAIGPLGPDLEARVAVRHAPAAVAMNAGPREALRADASTSMRQALDAAAGSSSPAAAVSAGNTAALVAMAARRLGRPAGVSRPAIAALWPLSPRARAQQASCVVLDVGAGLSASAAQLVELALMGAEYARIALSPPGAAALDRPRVALLNVGAEDIKGRPELRQSAEQLTMLSSTGAYGFSYVGFIEASDIAAGSADVVVTDGFTGNIALKSAEGAARLVGDFTRAAFTETVLARLAAFAAAPVLSRLHRRMDPRRVNGGVLLGLDQVIVKSHGAADAVGLSCAIELAAEMGRRNVAQRIAAQVAKLRREAKDRPDDTLAL